MTSTDVVHAVVAHVVAAKLSTTYIAESPGNDKKVLACGHKLRKLPFDVGERRDQASCGHKLRKLHDAGP
eukprot:8315148-Prorocentrum_lima.AAC.1